MKKFIITILLIIFCSVFLCSCSSNHSKDVYFIHACAITTENDEALLLAVAQKQTSGKDEEYFVAKSYGKNVKEAVKNLSDKYSECYFATNEFFILPYDEKDGFFTQLSYLCESPLLPSTSRVVLAKNENLHKILESIKKESDIKKLIKRTNKQEVSFIHFLACKMSERMNVTLPVLSLDDKNEPEITEKKTIFGFASKSKKAEKENSN
ncbi:MAG: hypothetical protein J6K12_02325 [Clostridia bacterium]|nr:hypothetical protein [Clostridia bacterium]